MATFEITSPDGSIYQVDAPEGASEADALAHLHGHLASGQESEQPTGFLGRLQKAWENPSAGAPINLPGIGAPSLIGMAKSLYQGLMAPGQAAAGQFTPGTEKPGIMTEEDAFRQNQATDALVDAGRNMAGNVVLPEAFLGARATTPAILQGRAAAKEIGPGVNAGAVNRMAKSFGADELTPEIVAQQQGQLGPEAMALDMGRQMQGRAEAIASQPGKGQNTVLNAVESRVHGTDQFGRVQSQFGGETANRIKQTLDDQLGEAHNKVDLINGVTKIAKEHSQPLYQAVMDKNPVVNVPGDITSRPAVASAMKNATTLARNYGEKLEGPTETQTILQGPGYHIANDVATPAQTSLKYWDYVKKGLDSRINSYMKSGGSSELNSADKADLGGLMSARDALRDHLDAATNGEYAMARRAGSLNKQSINEAYDIGRSAFGNKLLPEEFADQINNMNGPEQVIAKAGYRRELEQLIDTSRNDGAKARALLDTNSNLQKTENLFGPQARQAIEDRIAAETQFQQAANNIAANSRTQVKGQLVKDTESPSQATKLPEPTVLGTALKLPLAAYNAVRNASTERTREAIANMSTMKGPELTNLAEVLAKYNQGNVRTAGPAASQATPLAQALIGSQLRPLITVNPRPGYSSSSQ